MKRPDLRLVERKPMARAPSGIATARHRGDGQSSWSLYTAGGALDLDVLHRLIESAEAVTEGQSYPGARGETFFGTCIMTFDLARASRDGLPRTAIDRLAVDLLDDARARRALEDRVFRELARLLGPHTPAEFDIGFEVERRGAVVRLTADLEAPLPAVADGGR